MSAAEPRIHIIGVGGDGLAGLTSRGRELLTAADLVLGSEPTLGLLPALKAEKVRIGSDLQEVVRLLENRLSGGQRLVIVAGGDPLFYGVARYLCDRLGKDRFEVLPHVSSMQLAFARIKESWEEAYLTNLATHPLDDVLDRIRTAETVGLFTNDHYDPARVARELLARGLDYFRGYVCENLGAPNERVTQGELAELAELDFDPLNVMILKRKPGRPDQPRPAGFRRFGNPDDVFAQSRPKSGLVTQAEVRAIALAQLDIQPGHVVWDIGAGSGSVAIEAAQLAHPGIVHAIEQDAADYHLILANAETFGVKNLKAVHATAPAGFADLPAPDAVFVGGTGREVARLLEAAFAALRPGGRLVVNIATLEMLNAAYSVLRSLAGQVQVLLVNLARGTEQLETLRFEAVNPTFLLSVTKSSSAG
ncbi:MAG: precorrin-6y C5,15-methyltransferase (decarboxylating) subunit CbiE [Planctomycetia bacterium]|nr:precorrin-6y C5,15-methyltransferase (decarboxylating) subunit CbiE [Planctomycetia bacterium]